MISDRIIISSNESMIDYMGKYNMKKAGISLKKQLLIIFLFIAFIPMTVTALLLYHFQTQNALNAEIESQIQVLKLVTSNIYQKLTYFNNLTASIYYNDDIMSCLEKGQATLLSSPDKKRIQPAIDSLMRTDDMILSVSLTTMAGDTLYWNDGYSNAIHINSLDPDFLQKIYAHNGSGVLSNPITHTSKRKYPASNTSIYYGRLLRSLTHNFRPIGILLVEVDIASFEDLKGKNVAVKNGTQGAAFAESLKDQYGFTTTVFEDSPTMYQDVIQGNSVACVEDKPIRTGS